MQPVPRPFLCPVGLAALGTHAPLRSLRAAFRGLGAKAYESALGQGRLLRTNTDKSGEIMIGEFAKNNPLLYLLILSFIFIVFSVVMQRFVGRNLD